MTIAVIGAAGTLGEIITRRVAEADRCMAVARRRSARWPASVEHVASTGRDAAADEARALFARCDCVILAAPLGSAQWHRQAIESDCHVVDIGIDEKVIAAALRLDELAIMRGKSAVLMAGLAPGATGLLALEAAAAFPAADRIDLCLVQHARGTAGRQGTADMLDLLTDLARAPYRRYWLYGDGRAGAAPTRAFRFPIAEQRFLDVRVPIRYHTRFNAASLNRQLRMLAWLRRAAPPVYRAARDMIAARKSRAAPPAEEPVRLSAVALSGAEAMGSIGLSYTGDYPATAAIAVALARKACAGTLAPGAGHPAYFTSWPDLVRDPLIAAETID